MTGPAAILFPSREPGGREVAALRPDSGGWGLDEPADLLAATEWAGGVGTVILVNARRDDRCVRTRTRASARDAVRMHARASVHAREHTLSVFLLSSFLIDFIEPVFVP